MSVKDVTIVIPGPPVPKGRPRRGAGGRVYTPEATRRAEETVAWHARSSRCSFSGDVCVLVEFYVSSRRPDADNLAKLVFDGLQKGGLLVNDRQVREFTVRLVDVARGDEKTFVQVEEV